MISGPVALFVTPSCPHCADAIAYLAANAVEYMTFDVTTDAEALRRLLWFTGTAFTPTIIVGEEAVIGFDAERLDLLFSGAPTEEPDDAGGEEPREFNDYDYYLDDSYDPFGLDPFPDDDGSDVD